MKCLMVITVLLLIQSASLQVYRVKQLSELFKNFENIHCKEAVQVCTPVKAEECSLRDALECFMKGLRMFSAKCSKDLEQANGLDTISNIYMFLHDISKQMAKPTESCLCMVRPVQDFRAQLIGLMPRVIS